MGHFVMGRFVMGRFECESKQPLAEIAIWRGAPAVYYHYAGANSSAENHSPESHPGLKCTRTAYFEKNYF
jgi:hypothetical protein